MGAAQPVNLFKYDDALRRRSAAIRYLEGYIQAHLDEEDITLIEDQLCRFVIHAPYTSDRLDQLYRDVRRKERKVPGLYFPNAIPPDKYEANAPSLSRVTPLQNGVTVVAKGQVQTIYIDKVPILSYSPHFQEEPEEFASRKNRKTFADLEEEGLQGRIHFNSDFFSAYDLPKKEKSNSEIRNMAKAFFYLAADNHVALVQYLHPDGTTSEHYHELEEIIVQLAGKSCLELRPVENDTQRQITELSPGDVRVIPPSYLHRLFTLDEGSITVPIKKTNPHKSDHHYKERSTLRIEKDIQELLGGHYNSGDELIDALVGYHQELSPEEKKRVQATVQRRSSEDATNINVRTILRAVLREIKGDDEGF